MAKITFCFSKQEGKYNTNRFFTSWRNGTNCVVLACAPVSIDVVPLFVHLGGAPWLAASHVAVVVGAGVVGRAAGGEGELACLARGLAAGGHAH